MATGGAVNASRGTRDGRVPGRECMTVSAERPFAPKGRRTVATGGIRHSRTEPVVFWSSSQTALKGRRNRD